MFDDEVPSSAVDLVNKDKVSFYLLLNSFNNHNPYY